jgi:hypothetical protein
VPQTISSLLQHLTLCVSDVCAIRITRVQREVSHGYFSYTLVFGQESRFHSCYLSIISSARSDEGEALICQYCLVNHISANELENITMTLDRLSMALNINLRAVIVRGTNT